MTEWERTESARLPELRYVGVLATGYNVVDVAAASERGIASESTGSTPMIFTSGRTRFT